MRFAGLERQEAVPDAKTIRLCREHLTRGGALTKLFARLDAMLAERGFPAMGGPIADAAVQDPANTGSGVWGDTAYRGQANLARLDRRGLRPEFRRAKPRGLPMPACIGRGNTTRAKLPSLVERVFAAEKRRMGLVVRCIGLTRPMARIALAKLAYNMRPLAWLGGRAVPA